MGIDILIIQVNITLEWMPEDLVDVSIGSGNGLEPSGIKPLSESQLTKIFNTIGSGNGLEPSGNKPLSESQLTKIFNTIWRHYATMS